MKSPFPSVRSQAGASLIEVLVSIVIASVGLLALAGVNSASIRYTKMSQYRATASMLANDIGERMRANKAGFTAGNYDFETNFEDQATAPTLSTSELCSSSVCTAQGIANLDIKQWRLSARDQLPEGSVFLKRSAATSSADVWVVWRDPAVASTDEAPARNGECPNGLDLSGDASIRCSFFRINL